MADKRKRGLMIGGVAAGVILVVAGVLLFGGGGAPTLAITGIVTDRANGQPVAGARVSDDGYGPEPYQGANTETDGRYHYFTWPEEHTIIAEASGYKPQRQSVNTGVLQSADGRVVDFELEPEAKAE